MAYATLSDLQAYTAQPPIAGDDRLLQRASDLLDAALLATIYNTDGSGNPTDPPVIAAMRDATCAQVESWKVSGDERGDADQWQEMSLGPAKLVRRTIPPGVAPGAGAAGARLCPRAIEALRVANLWPGTPFLR